jgi:hypothetical protein
MIVANNAKALSVSTGAENFISTFNTKAGANSNLVSCIWTNNSGVWSNGGKYLNLSNAVIGDQKTIAAGIARAGNSGLAVSLNGGKYLTYNNGSFQIDDKQVGAITLYSVTKSPVWEMTYANDRFGQIIISSIQK